MVAPMLGEESAGTEGVRARAPSKLFSPPLGCEFVPVRHPGNRMLHSGYRQAQEALRRCSRRDQCRNRRKSVVGHGAKTYRFWAHHGPPGGQPPDTWSSPRLVPRHVADNRSNGKAHESADLPQLGSELCRSDNRQRVPCYVFSKNGKGGQFGSFALTSLMCRQCYGSNAGHHLTAGCFRSKKKPLGGGSSEWHC
jgi:hypothetical protein